MKSPGLEQRINLILVGVLLLLPVTGAGCARNPLRKTICDIQGPGLVSPFLDQEVRTEGLIVADLGETEPGGYLILDEQCASSHSGSGGLYLSFKAGNGLIALGDRIEVVGIVREIAGETRLKVNPQGLKVLSIDNPLPAPAELKELLPSPLIFGFEMWEGQAVSFPQLEVLDQSTDSQRALTLPRISGDPSAPLVCLPEENLLLELDYGFIASDQDPVQSPAVLTEVVGWIREDQHGYYLQVSEPFEVPLTEPKPPNNRESSATSGPDPEVLPPNTPRPSATASPTAAPTSTPFPTPRPTVVPSPTAYPIRLLITEILPNPSGEEPEGEWLEIYNLGGGRLPLAGIKLGDAVSPAAKEGMLAFPPGFFIHEGQVMVIANQARDFESLYGFLPDFEMVNSDPRVPNLIPYPSWGGSVIKLANSGDEVLLVDPWDQVVDLVVYGKSGRRGCSPPVPAPKEGNSLERYPPDQDTDQGNDWRERSSPSPGRLDYVPPTLPATRTGKPPATTPSSSPSPQPTLSATTSGPTASASATITLVNSATSPPLPTTPAATCTRTATILPETQPAPTSLTPTVSPLPSFSETPTPVATTAVPTPITGTITPSATVLGTRSPTAAVIPSGTSTLGVMTPTPSASPRDTSRPSPSPTLPLTMTSTPGPVLIINEILADPDPILGDSNRDGMINVDDDEFLELVNIGDLTLDLSGWIVRDAVRQRFIFPEGTSLNSGCALVIFGGGNPAGDFGGSMVFTASSLALNNAGDEITLLDPSGQPGAAISYGGEGNQNQSLTRDPDLSGPLPLVLHSMVPGSAGALFSPGTKNDQTAFDGCP